MKISFFIFTVFIIGLQLYGTSHTSLENIMSNGGFEKKSSGKLVLSPWTKRTVPSSSVKYLGDTDVKHGGTQSLKMLFDVKRQGLDEGYIYLVNEKNKVFFEPGRKYRVTCFVKAEGFSGNVGLLSGKHKVTRNVSGSCPWQKLSIDFEVPEKSKADKIRLYADAWGGGNGGTVWWDDFCLYDITETPMAVSKEVFDSKADIISFEKKSSNKIFYEDFKNNKLNSSFWQYTDKGVTVADGYCVVGPLGQILSQKVYPEGVLEMRLALTEPVGRGAIAWGWRLMYGSRPRITFSVEDIMKLITTVYGDTSSLPDNGDIYPIDTEFHIYRIVWTKKAVGFFVDGKLVETVIIPEHATISPRPVTVYNSGLTQASNSSVKVDWVSYRTPYTREELADIQKNKNFTLGQDRTQQKPLKFKKLIHIDPAKLPKIDEFWRNRGYVLFTRPYIEHIFQKDSPRQDEVISPDKGLRIFATPGEYEPATIAIHALKKTEQYHLTLSDFASSDGNIISKENISIGTVRHLNKRLMYNFNWSPEYMEIPVFIENNHTVDIEAGTNKQFWLTAKIPENAKPGIYRGIIMFSSIYGPEGGIPTEIPFTIEVLPFSLDLPAGYSLGFWPTGSELFLQDMERQLKIMREHGMTFVATGLTVEMDTVKDENNKIVFSCAKESNFIRFNNAYKAAGFPEPSLLDTDRSAANWATLKAGKGKAKEWDNEYKRFMNGFTLLYEQKEWLVPAMQTIDEPAWRSETAKEDALRRLKLLSELNIKSEIDGAYDSYVKEQALPYCKIINVNGGLPTLSEIRSLKAQGKTIWAYNNDVEGIRPEVERYSAGYWLWISGADGYNNWGYINKGSTASIYDDLSGEVSNFVYYYPETSMEIGGPALVYEAFREGIDDLRYLLTWKRLVEQTEKRGAKEKAEKSKAVVNKALSKIRYNTRLRNMTEWTKSYPLANGDKAVEGDLKIKVNGISFQDYDRIREVIAREIVKLIQK